MALNDAKIRSSKPSKKQVKLFDGDGLFLLVTPQGGGNILGSSIASMEKKNCLR